MSQLCDALTSVLDRAAQLDRRRLAGYAANVDFWTDEIQHRLRIIDGFIERRRRMVSGTRSVYAADIDREAGGPFQVADALTEPNVTDVSADWDALELRSRELREQVLRSAKRFVRKCLQTGLIDSDKLFDIEDRLGANLRGRCSSMRSRERGVWSG